MACWTDFPSNKPPWLWISSAIEQFDDTGGYQYSTIIAGWWFETFFIFPYIGNNDPN